jgi:hypothetical protein
MVTPSTTSHFIGMTSLNVQANFNIPLFEGEIGSDALEKW